MRCILSKLQEYDDWNASGMPLMYFGNSVILVLNAKIRIQAGGDGMGTYFNPNYGSFKTDKNSRIYIDKTELLAYLNEILCTNEKYIAISHARRFGKSHAAGMIDAYYSLGADSASLFQDTRISEHQGYEEHLNKYNVIHIDVSSFWDSYQDNIIAKISEYIIDDISKVYGDKIDDTKMLNYILMNVYEISGIPFVIILDEWDCPVRNSEDRGLVHKYLQFLHSLFKSEESRSFLALAYITGILPIKKIKDESALNNFKEFTMLKSRPITEFFGFTEGEVRELCSKYHMDFDIVRAWYDGYTIDGIHMYNPNSVVRAMTDGCYDSYWKNTSSFSSVNTFITMNYEGLKDDVLAMLGGGRVHVNTNTFQNDFSTVATKDDALTALIHMGYLGYDAERRVAYIPNYEVAAAFEAALQVGEWKDVANIISRCDELLYATIDKDADKVAEIIEIAHETYTSVLKYNDENSLSCVLTMAYFTAPAYYSMIREMPSGKGFADLAFIPRSNAGFRPAILVELKYNQSADTALKQIKERRYHGVLANTCEQVLLVGINYDTKSKVHTCAIEEYRMG